MQNQSITSLISRGSPTLFAREDYVGFVAIRIQIWRGNRQSYPLNFSSPSLNAAENAIQVVNHFGAKLPVLEQGAFDLIPTPLEHD